MKKISLCLSSCQEGSLLCLSWTVMGTSIWVTVETIDFSMQLGVRRCRCMLAGLGSTGYSEDAVSDGVPGGSSGWRTGKLYVVVAECLQERKNI